MKAALSQRKPVEGHSVRRDFSAIWLVRSRVLRGDLNFWLVVIGYDTKTSSFNNRLYLVYAIAFFAIWIFMVLTFLADFAARFLNSLPFATPQAAAVGAGSLAVLILFLYELYRSAQRSPFIFSEADAHLLCPAPVDRRPVALIWLLQAWVERGLAVWAGAVVLGYALLQALFPRPMTAGDLPVYLVAGFRMFAIAVPLYLAVLALAWAVGAWRLHGARERANLRWVAPAVLLVLGGGIAATGPNTFLTWLLPVNFLIQSGLGLSAWGIGLGISALLAVIGLLVLWQASREMSLVRAAQETRDKQAIQAARMTMHLDLANELATRQRLSESHAPSRLPARPGLWALVWKNTLLIPRRFNINEVFAWLGITGIALGMLTLTNWGTRGWGILIWTLMTAEQVVVPLRRELSRWWILRQLPFASERMVTSIIALPVVGVWLAGLAGIGLSQIFHAPLPFLGIWLYFVLAPSVGLAAVIDVLRQCKSNELFVGNVPGVTFWSLVFGLALVAIDGGFVYLLVVSWGFSQAASAPIVMAGSLGVLYGIWQAAGSRLRQLK